MKGELCVVLVLIVLLSVALVEHFHNDSLQTPIGLLQEELSAKKEMNRLLEVIHQHQKQELLKLHQRLKYQQPHPSLEQEHRKTETKI